MAVNPQKNRIQISSSDAKAYVLFTIQIDFRTPEITAGSKEVLHGLDFSIAGLEKRKIRFKTSKYLVMFIRAGIFILIYLGELVFWKNSFMPRVKSIPINVAGRRIIISFNISPYLSITLLVLLNLFLAYLCILCPKSVVQ